MSTDNSRQIPQLEKILNIRFSDQELLSTAITHSSYANRHKSLQIPDNERLEFFGDAVLKLIVSEYLYTHFPDHREGDLTKMRAQIVSDKTLAQLSANLGLGTFLRLSLSEQRTGGYTRVSNLANVFEAVLGAIYLDAGLETAREFVLRQLHTLPHLITAEPEISDYKSYLQEFLQQKRSDLPDYRVCKEDGPAHQKTFHVEATIQVKTRTYTATGIGASKKEAEQAAAAAIIGQLDRDPV